MSIVGVNSRYLYYANTPTTNKYITGINRLGSILSGYRFFIFSMDKPELAIRIPPTIDSSVIMSAVITEPHSKVSKYILPCHKNNTGAASAIPMP